MPDGTMNIGWVSKSGMKNAGGWGAPKAQVLHGWRPLWRGVSTRIPMKLMVFLLAVLHAMTMPCVFGDRPGHRGPHAPWEELEEELKAAGHATDSRGLVKLIQRPPNVRGQWMAIEVVGLRRETGAVEALRVVRTNAVETLIRESAALALARMEVPGGLEALIDAARESKDDRRRVFLACRLAEFGRPEALSLLDRAARSRDRQERFLAVAGLVEAVGRDIRPTHASGQRTAATRLQELSGDEDPRIRDEVVVQIATLGFRREYRDLPPELLGILRAIVASERSGQRRDMANGVLELTRGLSGDPAE